MKLNTLAAFLSSYKFYRTHGNLAERRNKSVPHQPAMARVPCHLPKICAGAIVISSMLSIGAYGQSKPSFPFQSHLLTDKRDLSSVMVQNVDSFLTRQTERAKQERNAFWKRDFSSPGAFDKSIASQRELLLERLGAVDTRVAPKLEFMTDSSLKPLEVEIGRCIVKPVRWQVLEGLWAEGLLLQPKGKIYARAVIIPDADVLPEELAGLQGTGSANSAARQLAEAGWQVLIPVLSSREDSFSGNPSLGLNTNMPHREWIYRQAYEVGRHVIGYELQKVFSAIDWFESQNRKDDSHLAIGVAGYGEGGLLALNAAALDIRISSTLVSGYFNAREGLWREPIYRNVFGLLKYFGDAELAVMTWPRTLVVQHSSGPEVQGPPAPSKGRRGAAPGILTTPDLNTAKEEWDRAIAMLPVTDKNRHWIGDKQSSSKQYFSKAALQAFAAGLHAQLPKNTFRPLSLKQPGIWLDVEKRQERTVREMENCVQQVVTLSERTRNQNFWQVLKGDTSIQRPVKEDLRKKFSDQLGALPTPTMPINPRARLLERTEKWTSYEVMLDVWPGVFAWGILQVPNNLKAGERRPVVVCQHGLEGVPNDVVTTDSNAHNFHFYKGFASRLADRGYITFSPYNLYRGGDKFRVLQRKGNPVGLTLFSVIIGQHQRLVEWLKQLPFVEPTRIGFYGLSYGGKSAMRIPAIVKDYALSICSGDFNEWIRKCASTKYSFSYLYTQEYDMQEWDLGHTFGYAEMAGLIAPRPFMVERGHFDNVAADEWVAYEYAKVSRHYALIGMPESTEIEYFVGPHTIHGVGTFEFLDRHLKLEAQESHLPTR